MDKLLYEPTKTTPWIFFDPQEGILELKGVCSPECATVFFDGLFRAIDDFISQGGKSLKATFDFVYFNTSTSKCLYIILKKAKGYHNAGHEVKINWFYEENDDEMKEVGEDFADLLDLPFHICEKEEI